MGRYVLRRLLQLIPVFFGTTFIIYALVWGLPGDIFAGKCGQRPCPDAYVEKMTDKYNLDDPLIIQYLKYLLNLLQGDLGETFNGTKVAILVGDAYPITVRLAIVALIIEAVIGLLAGIVTGLRGGKYLDNLVLISTLFLLSLPTFVTGFLLQYYLGIKWEVISPNVSGDATFGELIVPGFVLGSLSMAFISRLMRSGVLENKRADYVRTAVAKGLSRRRVVGVHLLRNSLIPVITFLGTDLGSLMGGAIITEGVFNIKGVGGLVFGSITRREGSTVVAIVVLLVLVYLLMNLIVDLLYAILDPRIRYE